ncbi:UNVERIFIED_CONTAM: hypothetical protein FKN15_020075 [Acipenser sinensis]
MDIRKFFVVKQQKNPASELAKNGEPKSEYDGKKKSDLSKVKSLNSDDDDDSAKKTKQRGNKKKRVIVDSDSEDDVPVKKHRKPSKESPSESKSSSKPAHPPKKDPVVYVSETDEEDNFESLKQLQKRKENGLSASSRPGSTGRAVEVKPPAKPVEVKPPAKAVTPAKCTPMSVFEYFGGSSVQRSDKKLVATTKRKANKKSMLVTPEKPAKRAESAKRETPTPPKTGSSPSTVAGKKSLSFQQSSLEKVETPAPSESKGESLLWVDRYKPTSLKNIIGQQGDQSCANKLLRWLRNWHHNAAGDKKPAAKFSKFGGKDDGSTFKAALLSGPPGVGKTTTAALVCEELGFSYVEQNASCTRSKNSLKVVIAESLNNTSIKNFYSGTSQTVSSKHVLIMDEVDGMAGNEDRGGIQELIGLIKNTKIPIICMCNDRNHQKIRSLVNYCFDLRFQRPRVEQIKVGIDWQG